MPPFLFGEALAQGLHELLETELLDLRPLLRAQIAFGHLAQPFLGQFLRLDGG